MKIRVTKRGIYGGKGMIAIGTELEVDEMPRGWDSKCVVIEKQKKKGKTAVTNPADKTEAKTEAKTETPAKDEAKAADDKAAAKPNPFKKA